MAKFMSFSEDNFRGRDSKGSPLNFHHTIWRVTASNTYESFGVPFARVMACHKELRGSVDTEYPQRKPGSAPPSADWDELAPLQHFNVKIVEEQQAFMQYSGLDPRVKMMVTEN